MAGAKRQGEKAHKNRTKGGPRTRVRTSSKTTALLDSSVYIGQAQGSRKQHMKRGAKIKPRASLLFASFGSTCLHALRMHFPLFAK